MDSLALINKLRNDGCSIVVNGSYLDISPADNLKPELIDRIKNNKVEILCVLHREKELRRMVNLVCHHYGLTKDRHREALMAALNDQANAITNYAALAYRAGLFWCTSKEKTKAFHVKKQKSP